MGKVEFAAVLGIGWTSVAVDVRSCKRVQAVADLWKGGVPGSELKSKYKGESAASMCHLADKLINADKKRLLREASGMLPEKGSKRPKKLIVPSKVKQVEGRKRERAKVLVKDLGGPKRDACCHR